MLTQQLTVSAPQAEAFSGNSDGAAPAGLKVIRFASNASGRFSTVAAITTDGVDFPASRSLLVSRTNMSVSTLQPIDGPTIGLADVRKPVAREQWVVKFTRPRSVYLAPSEQPLTYSNGALIFPTDERWTVSAVFRPRL